MVIWVTGLSGAGKTTLCGLVYEALKPNLPELVLLDGDNVREAFGGDLDYHESDRIRQVKRMRAMCRLLSQQGLVVLVAVLYSNPELLAWNRENLPGYYEVFLDASLDAVRSRDPKGLYAKAERGEMKDVVGIDVPWFEPATPDLRLDGSGKVPPEELAQVLLGELRGKLGR